MAERVLGPTGSRRRRRFLIAPVLGVVLIALLAIGSAQGLSQSAFELDKDATNDVATTKLGVLKAQVRNATATSIDVCDVTGEPSSTPFTILIDAEQMSVTAAANASGGGCTARRYTVTRGVNGSTATAHAGGAHVSLLAPSSNPGDDWDQIYAAVSADPNTKCTALGADECGFEADPKVGDASYFQGGGSKDDLDIPNWSGTGNSVPPSDEILDAMAAKYTIGGNQLLVFAADRWSTNGAKDFGFWFFHDEVAYDPVSGKFSGQHTAPSAGSRGDILVLGTFTQGGAVATARVFEWVGTGGNATANGTVSGPIASFGDCVPGSASDKGCITVNNTSIVSPWPYESTDAAFPGFIPSGGFVEGGIDLTALGLEGCFSSFIAETRSAPSVDAQLKDFVIGKFEACGSSLTTTPGNGATPSVALTDSNSNALPDVSIGSGSVQVKDKALLTVSGTSTWSGSLSFYLCGPIATGTCESGGVPIGSAQSVNQSTTMPVDSAAATLTSVGRYCWRGEFTSATQGVPNATDSSSGECFEVLPVTPPLDTQAVASSVNFGQAVQDNATLSGTATQPGTNGPSTTYPTINATNGAAAGGVITFTLLKADCSTLATGTGTNPQDVTVSGNGTYGPVSFTPDAPGTYHWKAQYIPATGDPNNIGSTHNAACNDSDETVVVQKAPTEISTAQSVYPNDSATVSVAAANAGTGNVQGSVKFRLYDSLANCQATTPSDTVGTGGLLYKQTVNLPGDATSSTVSTSNTSVAVSADAVVYWLVEFTSTNQAQFGRKSVCAESTDVDFTNDAGPGTAP